MRSSPHPAVVFVVIFVAIFLLHAPLLQLPYFWDEAGYYVPAARDLLLTGSLIPHTTISNAHPPLVMAWVALWWKAAGYAPVVTRSAMLVIAAFSLMGVFRLAARVANPQVAAAATLCTALYPVFFAQSSLAQVDLAAAGLTFWALSAYMEDRPVSLAIWFSLAVLAKETAILTPIALACWQVLGNAVPNRSRIAVLWNDSRANGSRIFGLLFPLLPLTAWYAYHYSRTGYVFGNPEFFRYNVASTLNPLRFLIAFVLRLWQAFGYMHLWILTAAMLLGMQLKPVSDAEGERPRISIPTQAIFLVIVFAYVVAMALIGGAVLARYMLPAVPLVIILAVSTLRRRLRYWMASVAIISVVLVSALFWNPPYGFSPEDNLAYADYIRLHQGAESFIETHDPHARVLTAWPASDELSRPYLGYVKNAMKVVRIEDFTAEQLMAASDARSSFDWALVFSTKYQPPRSIFDRWRVWQQWKTRFFGYHVDLSSTAAASILGGELVYKDERQGQWVGVIRLQRIEEAQLHP